MISILLLGFTTDFIAMCIKYPDILLAFIRHHSCRIMNSNESREKIYAMHAAMKSVASII